MKLRDLFWMFGLFCCVAFLTKSLRAQDEPADEADPPAATTDTESTAEESPAADETPVDPDLLALWDLKVIYEEACNTSDPAKLKPHLTDDFTGVMVTNETVTSYDDIQSFWDMVQSYLGEGGTYKVTVNLDQDAHTDGRYALAHGTTDDSAVTSSGAKVNFTTKWTAVCRKDDEGNWKIWRIHGSMNPFDNPFTSTAGGITIFMTAAIAGLIGIVLGFVGAGVMSGKGE